MRWLVKASTGSDTSPMAVHSYLMPEGELETLGEDTDETTASLGLGFLIRNKAGDEKVASESGPYPLVRGVF